MVDNFNQPGADDVVLGSETLVLNHDLVMASIEDLRRHCSSAELEQRIAALLDALKYGQEGLDRLIQALQDESWQVQGAAFLLLRDRSEPEVQQAIQAYLAIDGEYAEDREDVKRFISEHNQSSDYPWILKQEDEDESPVPVPELLQLMKWGEVIAVGDYRFDGVYIVDCNENGKLWRQLPPDSAAYGTIPLKFLQKKGYRYYLNGPCGIDIYYLPSFNGKEGFDFVGCAEINESANFWGAAEFPLDATGDDFTFEEIVGEAISIPYTAEDEGFLFKENERWFLRAEDGIKIELPKYKNFYKVPEKYLIIRGYNYYVEISQNHQLPLIGYLSPKEYFDFLNFEILDWSSLNVLS